MSGQLVHGARLTGQDQSSLPASAVANGTGSDLRDLPLSFVPNAGQSDPSVRFQTRAMGGTIFFSPEQIDLVLPAATARLRFEGASASVQLTGDQRLPGVAHSFTGKDTANWHTNLPTYGAIVYRQLYPGIDLRYDGADGRLKSTYTLAPGADPTRIRWRYDGASAIRVDQATGDLLITVPASGTAVSGPSTSNLQPSTITEKAPVAWQDIDGRRVPVAVRYTLLDAHGRPTQSSPSSEAKGPNSKLQSPSIGFTLGAFDPDYALTIDPTLEYGSYLGGIDNDGGEAIGVDGEGNVYVAGYTRSRDFPGREERVGGDDIFVAKLDPTGSSLLYTAFIAGGEDERPSDLVVDAAGNVYLAGYTGSEDFPTLSAALSELQGGWDFIAAKLDPDGELAYSTYLGTEFTEDARGIAVDPAGSAYVTGQINGRAIVYKLSPDGESVVYEFSLGGEQYGTTIGTAIAVDDDGQAYVTGQTGQKDFPTTSGALQQVCDRVEDEYRGCRGDVFIAKLNAEGTDLLYSTLWGGLAIDDASGIALDEEGFIYVAGTTDSLDFPTENAIEAECPSGESDIFEGEACDTFEVFVAKFEPDGADVVYSTYLGGKWRDYAYAIAVDGAGSAYVTGWTDGEDFPQEGEIQPFNNEEFLGCSSLGSPRFCIDAFVTKLQPDGSALAFSTYLGGADDDYGLDIAVDAAGSAYVTGNTLSNDLPSTEDALQPEPPDPGLHGFVVKIAGDSDSFAPPLDRPADASVYYKRLICNAVQRWFGRAALPACASEE